MTEGKPKDDSSTTERGHFFAWLLFPLALFPLVALMTYDWRSMPDLQSPSMPSTNWIGALGDFFAYYGYTLFGLAIWVVPLLCVIAGVCMLLGRRMRPGRRELWFSVLLLAFSCILQVLGNHAGAISSLTDRLNMSNAGGAIGYLVMTRFLSPLLSDFGSSVVMVVVMGFSLVAAVGAHNFAAFLRAIVRWALAPRREERDMAGLDIDAAVEQSEDEPDSLRELREQRAEAIRIKEAARRQREEEKAAIRAEKLAAKAEKAAAKEAAKEAAKAAKAEKTAVAVTTGVPTPAAATPEDGDKGPYLLPPISLLDPLSKSTADHGDVAEMARRLIDTLKLFGVDATLAYTVEGPVVTKYALELAPGTRYSAVTTISDNLMGALHAKSLRIEAPIPGENHIGIEVPNLVKAGISFREVLESNAWKNFKGDLPLLFGKDAAGKDLVADLAKMPHMLVAGATGQGKSVCLNAIINGLLMSKTPQELKLIMVDPKSVEFTWYASIPHLIVPIITDNKKANFALRWAVNTMEKRLKMFARAKVKNIKDFNSRPQFTQRDMFGDDTEVGSDMPKTVPYIVVIIDEVADLMATCAKEVAPNIARIAAKARAAGIHLILATQRPDAKVITGTIKANIPGRVAFKTSTAIDSRTILDSAGAENLIGKGDMLFRAADNQLIRAQGALISDPEIGRITQFIEQHSTTHFDETFTSKLSRIKEAEDNLEDDDEKSPEQIKQEAAAARETEKSAEETRDFKKAIECIIDTKRASISHFQRKLGWGYNHSARIMDLLEDAGIISPQSGAGPRQIILDNDQLAEILNTDDTSAAGEAVATNALGGDAEPDLFTDTGEEEQA